MHLIRDTLIDVCEKELGDRSLEGFDTRQRLREIEKDHGQQCPGDHAAKMPKTGGKNQALEGTLHALTHDVYTRKVDLKAIGHAGESYAHNKPADLRPEPNLELSPEDLVRMRVEGLDGKNRIRRRVGGGKLQVLLR
jgi:hypothetical protein